MDKPQRGSVQVKRGEKTFRITMEDGDQDEALPQQWQSDLEKALAAAVGDLPKEPGKPKYKKGPCPLRCEFSHPNKSAFF